MGWLSWGLNLVLGYWFLVIGSEELFANHQQLKTKN
jgi:hypothetical protein